jgi:predicted DNA-binding transcriptional regulator AlpA
MQKNAELKPLNDKKGTAAYCLCSTRQIEIQWKAGKFPKPIFLGTHPRWTRESIEKWVSGQQGANS